MVMMAKLQPNNDDFDFVVTATRTENDRKLKVPGDVPAVGKMSFEIARLREEIKTKTVPQLREILERQERILKNAALVKKLPDKGEKAKKTKDMIIELIKNKEKVDDLEEQMSTMKIDTEKMEWKGSLLDSDDDSDPEDDVPTKNPLSVLAQGIVPKHSSKAKEPEASNEKLSDLEAFAVKEAAMIDNLKPKQSFVPYKNTKVDKVTEDLKKELGPVNTVKSVNTFKIKEIKPKTPAIPLPNVYTCETKMMTLSDSLILQQEQAKKLREIELKHAAEKLTSASVKLSDDVNHVGAQFEEYRHAAEEEADHEADDDDEGHGVVGITQLADADD